MVRAGQRLPGGWFDPFEPVAGGQDWLDYPALTDLFPWQQPGCMWNRTWPVAPTHDLLVDRWSAFVAIEDPAARADAYVTPRHGRSITTRVPGLPRLVDLGPGAPSEPIVRFAPRSFDRQWAFADPRLAKTESPSLWASVSDQQIFLTSLLTSSIGRGPGATVATSVPDKHHFRGSFGAKDVVPLYRDARGTPNADPKALGAIGEGLGPGATAAIEDLFAYVYAVLGGADYTERFAEELLTPGPRIPLTADADLFAEAVAFGRELLWLHTYGERFSEGHDGVLGTLLPSIAVDGRLTLPERPNDIEYDAGTQSLRIGDGKLTGVTPEVWAFEVSGMAVVKKWLGYRTARGAGRAASSSSPLDQIRPTSWADEWTTELLELLSVLQRTIDLQPRGIDLLDRVVAGPLIAASDLPEPPAELRKPPTGGRGPTQAALEL
ncbi:MAG: hypothetical protein M5U19_05530 [Microthrixaceae bacterium]|nr:hypothetical protein [Microthrixaceae bacterium]